MGDKALEALQRFARGKPTTLYHFTRVDRVVSVLDLGINRGDVAVAHDKKIEAPWLTVEPRFSEQFWAPQVERVNRLGSVGPMNAIKTEARFTVIIPPSHIGQLHHWLTWAQENKVDPAWLASMIKSDGGQEKASQHWFYRGTIKPEWITTTTLRDEERHEPGRWGFRGFEDVDQPALILSGGVIGKDILVTDHAQIKLSMLKGSMTRNILEYVNRQRAGDLGVATKADHLNNVQTMQHGEGLVTSRFETLKGILVVETTLSKTKPPRTVLSMAE